MGRERRCRRRTHPGGELHGGQGHSAYSHNASGRDQRLRRRHCVRQHSHERGQLQRYAGGPQADQGQTPHLGHATVSVTLDTYSHALPAMQEEAAALIAGLVFAVPSTQK